jgi:hypothetical protein
MQNITLKLRAPKMTAVWRDNEYASWEDHDKVEDHRYVRLCKLESDGKIELTEEQAKDLYSSALYNLDFDWLFETALERATFARAMKEYARDIAQQL